MSNWSQMYESNNTPNLKQISKYINSPFWKELCDFIENNYNVEPKIEYSCCSLQPGWNVKYKKSNKSICTLYPNADYFTCMVTVGSKNQEEVEYMLPSCDEYIQKIYQNTSVFNNSRWLMIDVKSSKILEDIKELITIKMK